VEDAVDTVAKDEAAVLHVEVEVEVLEEEVDHGNGNLIDNLVRTRGVCAF